MEGEGISIIAGTFNMSCQFFSIIIEPFSVTGIYILSNLRQKENKNMHGPVLCCDIIVAVQEIEQRKSFDLFSRRVFRSDVN